MNAALESPRVQRVLCQGCLRRAAGLQHADERLSCSAFRAQPIENPLEMRTSPSGTWNRGRGSVRFENRGNLIGYSSTRRCNGRTVRVLDCHEGEVLRDEDCLL